MTEVPSALYQKIIFFPSDLKLMREIHFTTHIAKKKRSIICFVVGEEYLVEMKRAYKLKYGGSCQVVYICVCGTLEVFSFYLAYV